MTAPLPIAHPVQRPRDDIAQDAVPPAPRTSSSSMTILLIAQAYPPYPAVGAFRAQKIARAFRDAGHEVHVITERLTDALEAARQEEPGIVLHRVALGLKLRERVLGVLWRRRATPAPGASNGAAAADAPAAPAQDPRTAGLLKRFVIAMLWLPDDEQRFIRPALRAARPLMAGTALVYTTAPSWSTHIVGLLLQRRHRVRWAADFRDPWVDILPERTDRYSTAVTDVILRRIERAILRRADHVVAVATKTRDALAAKLPPDERGKFVLARNGIDVVFPAREHREPGPFRIAYAGSFYDDRDPRLFLRALARLRAQRPISASDLRVDFAGDCRTIGAVSVERLVADLGLDDLVTFHDWMPQVEARALLARADLLLVLARGMRLQVPNKLYEYLGLRIPIFAWADEDGETAAVLRALGGHHVVTDDDESGMAHAIERAITSTSASASSPDQDALLAEWMAERQMALLVAAVGA